jgi:trehalose 6-phosphate phosphatase
MQPHLSQHLSEVLRAISSAPDLFCFLDYDGTLAPIAPTPHEAVPLRGTTELLFELVRAPRTSVALVTGRTIEDIRGFIDITELYYVGVHGLELRRPGADTEDAAGATELRSLMPDIVSRLQERLAGRSGVMLEEKGAAVACHYRLASRADAHAAREAVIDVVRACQQRGASLTFIDGHEVTEIRPIDANKGRAVSMLLQLRQPPPLAMYIGDDRTDEDAFRQLPASAITIHVGSGETLARFRLEDPREVQEFLRAVVEARRG